MTILKRQDENQRNRSLRNEVLLLAMTIGLGLLYLIFVHFLGGMAILLDGSTGFAQRFTLQAAGAMCVLGIVLQVFYLVMELKRESDEKKTRYGQQLAALFVMDTEEPEYDFEGKSTEVWKKMVIDGYKADIDYLRNLFFRLDSGANAALGSYEEIYHAALVLSYVTDTFSLARLRLDCLEKIRLRPNANTDVDQILQMLPASEFSKVPRRMVIVQDCLKNRAETISQLIVVRLMRGLMKYYQRKNDGELVKTCMRCCGPQYLSALVEQEEFAELRPLYNAVLKEDKVFAAMAAKIEPAEMGGAQ